LWSERTVTPRVDPSVNSCHVPGVIDFGEAASLVSITVPCEEVTRPPATQEVVELDRREIVVPNAAVAGRGRGAEPVVRSFSPRASTSSSSSCVPSSVAPSGTTAVISGGQAPTCVSSLSTSASASGDRAARLSKNVSVSGALRVLVTGASGLLGRHVMDVLRREGWVVRGLCFSRAHQHPELVACDLTEEGAAAAKIEEFQPNVVIHLAAEWRPDVLRRNPTRTRQLNVDASGAISAACQRCGAWLLYVSADSVFDGRSPPYVVDAEPNPLSEYGWHKLHGEQLTMVACPQAAVLRVGLLYGPSRDISESAVTSLHADLLNGVREVDAWQRCYPTWTGDVAGVISAMLRLHRQGEGESLRGVFHWQGNEQFTWHEMMLMVAQIAGLDASDVVAVQSPPAAPLPRDTCLDCSRLEALLGPAIGSLRTPFEEGLQRCLLPLVSGMTSIQGARQASAEPPRQTPSDETKQLAPELAVVAERLISCHAPADGTSSAPGASPVGSSAVFAASAPTEGRASGRSSCRGATFDVCESSTGNPEFDADKPLPRKAPRATAVNGTADPEGQFRDELKKRGAALQELFWQELERTRSRLKEAGLAEGRRGGGQGSLGDRGDALSAHLPKRRMLKVEGSVGGTDESAPAVL